MFNIRKNNVQPQTLNNTGNNTVVTRKKHGLARIIIGVLMLVTGIGAFDRYVVCSILLILCGITCFPFFWSAIGKKWQYRKFLPVVIPILLFLLFSLIFWKTDVKYIDRSGNSETVTQEKEEAN